MTEATVVIKGRNELSSAVKSAERDLRKLTQQGEMLGRLLRGGAFAGALVAFTRLAEGAEKAAAGFGDATNALKDFNRELRTATAEAKRLGAALLEEALGELGFGGQARQITELERRLANARKRYAALTGGGVTGFLATDGDIQSAIANIEKYESALRRLRQNLPYGERDRAPGSRGGGRSVVLSEPPKAGKFDAMAGLEELNIWQREMFDFNTMANQWADDFNAGFTNQMIKDVNTLANETRGMSLVIEDAARETADWKVFADEAARQVQSSFAQFLFDPFEDGMKGMLKGFVDTMRQIAAQLASYYILRSFFTWGAGLGGGLGGMFREMGTALSAPGRAAGGPVTGGRPYMVGERGPELFVPGASGTIIPNGAGGGVNVTYNIDARGASQELVKVLPAILAENNKHVIKAAKAAVADSIRRNGYVKP